MEITVLRDYQANAVKAVMNAIQNGANRVSLEMAPGTGKTYVLAALLEQLLTSDTKILIVTSTKNEEYHIRTFLSDKLGTTITPSIIEDNVHITVYPRLLHGKYTLPLEAFSYIFLINHHEKSTISSLFADSHSSLIGFFSGKEQEQSLNTFNGDHSGKVLFATEDCVFRFPLSEAVQQGYLSPTIDPAMYESATIGFCQRLFTKYGGEPITQNSVHWSYGARIDLTYSFGDRKVLVECKIGRYEYLSSGALNLTLSRMSKVNNPNLSNEICLLIIIGKVTEQERIFAYNRHGIHVWDISNLLYFVQHDDPLYEELSKLSYFPLSGIVPTPPIGWIPATPIDDYSPTYILERARYLKEQLDHCTPGRKDAAAYEKLCQTIIEFLFPSAFYVISSQHKTKDDHFRMDLICSLRGESEATHPFWKILSNHYNSHFVVFEFKNYEDPIDQNLIYITEKYLFNAALRNVAIIISRKGFSQSAQFAANGCLKENGKLIMCLSDSDLVQMLDSKANGDNPEESLLKLLEANLMGISK